MLSRLINGLVTGLIAWSVTQSKWIALVVFGVTAGLSSNKFKWIEEITKTIKAEVDKAKNASTGATNSTTTTTTTTTANQQSTPTMQSAAAKMAAKLATNFPPKQAVPEMLESKNEAAEHARTLQVNVAGTSRVSSSSIRRDDGNGRKMEGFRLSQPLQRLLRGFCAMRSLSRRSSMNGESLTSPHQDARSKQQ